MPRRSIRNDNTFLGKVDFEAGKGRLSVTASRMRPFASVPRIQINNNQQYTNGSKRLSTNYVLTSNSWVSESRFGWNRNTLDRFDAFWLAESPTRGAQDGPLQRAQAHPDLQRDRFVRAAGIPKSSP